MYFYHENVSDVDNSLTGESILKLGAFRETITFFDGDYDIHPVYGLRFKGSDQYAAYRWELCAISSNDPLKLYLSVKIKALKKDDETTSIDDVANEDFWSDGNYIEFKIPAAGYGKDDSTIYRQGIFGYLPCSTLHEEENIFRVGFIHRCADIVTMTKTTSFLWYFVKAN